MLSWSRIQSNQRTEFCPESRETSQTNWNIMMWNPRSRVMTRGLSPRRTHRKLLPTLEDCSDVSKIAFHSLLVERKQRGLDWEMHQDPDKDRLTSDEEGTLADNAANELELIAVSKRSTRFFPHATVVRTNLEPSVQEATLLKKIWCVKLLVDAHVPDN